MATKKSQLYTNLWQCCNELRGGMDTSQYKDYILTLLFMKYVSDKAAGDPYADIDVPEGGSFSDMVALRGSSDTGEKINVIIRKFAEANDLSGVIDQADFDDSSKLGSGQEKQDKLSNLIGIFDDLNNLSANRVGGDDLLGDAYEYLMRHFATESGKSKGQFYTPAEVSHVIAGVIGIGPNTQQDETIYDPTCGSGSLLLRAADKAPRGLSIYGQEKDNSTHALARMNMILHNNADADLKQGNTLADPKFIENDMLRTFDFAVANPPFSDKAWTNGLKPKNDLYDRFKGYGIPPAKNGDYAFLLHFIKSLKSRGKGAIILPHGVLFRGNREADIRREIIQRGYIKGIIGLPANLFYGTGIPACILVIDKESADNRYGIFMIDASKGFDKDGNKNRLRAQDIHKIVSVFNEQTELPRYSRMVPLSVITAPVNDWDLKIPRYIPTSETEDLHDLEAHLNGGIPDTDVDALNDYWSVFPTLRNALFKANGRPGYSDPLVETQQVKTTILTHSEFVSYQQRVDVVFQAWREAHEDSMLGIGTNTDPKEVIHTLSEDLLKRFDDLPLLDRYDVYQRLMDYWEETMQDDVYLIATEGWTVGRILRLTYDKEDPDFTIKNGQKTIKYVGELIPASLVIEKFFDDERRTLEQLEAEIEEVTRRKEEFEEEHGDGEGALVGLEGSKGITKGNVQQRIKDLREAILEAYPEGTPEHVLAKSVTIKDLNNREWIKKTRDEDSLPMGLDAHYGDDEEGLFGELELLYDYLELWQAEGDQKKAHKKALDELYTSVIAKYAELTEIEIKTLLVEDKWLARIRGSIEEETKQLAQEFTGRVSKLEKRYAQPMPDLEREVVEFSKKVEAHLQKMGVDWV